MTIDRPLGHSRLRGDGGVRELLEPPILHQLARGLEDALARGLLLLLAQGAPVGRRHPGCLHVSQSDINADTLSTAGALGAYGGRSGLFSRAPGCRPRSGATAGRAGCRARPGEPEAGCLTGQEEGGEIAPSAGTSISISQSSP